MNIEIERNGFEAKYPVPDGVEYCKESNRYLWTLTMHYPGKGTGAEVYNARWEAWLARAEVEAGEAVATLEHTNNQDLNKIIETGVNVFKVYAPKAKMRDYTSAARAGIKFAVEQAFSSGCIFTKRELFTTPQPSDFNAGIEAAAKHVEEFIAAKGGIGIIETLNAILALRKGVA